MPVISAQQSQRWLNCTAKSVLIYLTDKLELSQVRLAEDYVSFWLGVEQKNYAMQGCLMPLPLHTSHLAQAHPYVHNYIDIPS